MNYNTAYIGMGTHKNSFTLRCFATGVDEPEHCMKIDPDY